MDINELLNKLINELQSEEKEIFGTVSRCKKGYVCKLPDISLATGETYYLRFYGKTKREAIRKRDTYILEKEGITNF